MEHILQAFGLHKNYGTLQPFGSGLINHTWKISNGKAYILQKINDSVFKKPDAIARNIQLIGDYLQKNHPHYFFTRPLPTKDGKEMLFMEGEGWFRLFEYVPQSHSIDVVTSPQEAEEAAAQFGRFTRLLAHFDAQQLADTIPHFHDLSFRFQQFETALQKGNKERIAHVNKEIEWLQAQRGNVDQYEVLKKSDAFKTRVTHHDTKISNVLFNDAGHGICVIDLDTVMPGYFISDVGDMMRTYLSPANEEEKDFSKIEVRDAYFEAIVRGYLSEMKEELSATEKGAFVYAGKFIIYMQALRFLTDYILNDVYYGSRYKGHNLVRARNQITLLQKLMEKEKVFETFVKAHA